MPLRTDRVRSSKVIVLVAVAVLMLGACGGDDEAGQSPEATATTAAETTTTARTSIPTAFKGGFYQLVEGAPSDNLVVQSRMRSDDGKSAHLTLTLTAPAPQRAAGGSGSVQCGGKAVTGALLQDAPGGRGTLDVEGVGLADLEIRENRAAFTAADAPPLCTEHRGMWVGTSGRLEGRRGTFVTFGDHTETVQQASLTLTEE